MGVPSMKISPSVGVSKPAINLRSVVLPQPDGPNRVTNCPLLMPRFKLSSTVTPSKTLVMPLISMMFSFFLEEEAAVLTDAVCGLEPALSLVNSPLILVKMLICLPLYQKLGGQEIHNTVAFLSVTFSMECFLSAL